jgi:hypothetical protein
MCLFLFLVVTITGSNLVIALGLWVERSLRNKFPYLLGANLLPASMAKPTTGL